MADINNIHNLQDLKEVIATYLVTPKKEALTAAQLNIILSKSIEFTSDTSDIYSAIGNIAAGAIGATPDDAPVANINVYKAITTGTYALFGGLTVSAADIAAGDVQLIKGVTGTWSKKIIPNDLLPYKKKEDPEFAIYASVAAANAGVLNTVVNGKNLRDGKLVQIGTAGNYVTYGWKGGFGDGNLIEYLSAYPNKNEVISPKAITINADNAIPITVTGLNLLSGYYDKNTGLLSGGSFTSVVTPVTKNDLIYLTTDIAGVPAAMAVFFDKNMSLISYFGAATSTAQSVSSQLLVLPDNIAFVGATRSGLVAPKLERGVLNPANKNDVKGLDKVKLSLINSFAKIVLVKEPGFITPTGGLTSADVNYRRASLVLTDDNRDQLYYTGVLFATGAVGIAYFDIDNKFISYELTQTTFKHFTRFKLTVPKSAVKLVAGGAYTSNQQFSNLIYDFTLELGVFNVNAKADAVSKRIKQASDFYKIVDPKPDLVADLVYNKKWYRQWFRLQNTRTISAFSFPVCRDFKSGTFITGAMRASFVTSLGHSFVFDIPSSEIAKYNELVLANSVPSDFDFFVNLQDTITLTTGDIIQISWSVVNDSDRMGLVYRYTDPNLGKPAEPESDFSSGGFVWGTDGTTGDGAIDYLEKMAAGTQFLRAAGLGISFASDNNKPIPKFIYPKRVYTVCNDVMPADYGNNRNFASAIYLDHFFTGFKKEIPLRFGNGTDRKIFVSPIKTTNGSNVRQYNGGVNVLKTLVPTKVKGTGYADSSVFNIEHISTLNSAVKSVIARALIIVDSIGSGVTQGVGASTPEDQRDGVYHLICKELFKKDSLDAGSPVGQHDILFLGHNVNTRTFNYKGADHTIRTCREGYPGMSTSQIFNDGTFNGSSPSAFSITNWLNKYRTMTDAGVRLAANDPAKGTAVTDVNAYDVCRPTHIIFATGANDSITYDWLGTMKTLVGLIKAEYAANGWGAVTVGVSPPDTAGTIFPSLYPNTPESMYAWNNADDDPGRHERMWKFTNDWLNDTTYSEDIDRVFFIPMFFTMPPISAAYRNTPLPNGELVKTPYGWLPKTHPDANAHAHWGYLLYSFFKYTFIPQ
ncbi:hypothetical protein [Pedobacter sp.]|uniref:hypothetical protein n=1 Tax=Pedobacter sp. TaxID=1411316 RepID=UPI003D7F1ACD